MVEHIAKLVQEKVITGISDLRDESDRKKMAVTSINSKDAVTHLRVLKRFKDATLIDDIENAKLIKITDVLDYPKVVCDDKLENDYSSYKIFAKFGFLFICLPSVALIFLTRRIKERNFKMVADLLFILSWFITGALSVVMSR